MVDGIPGSSTMWPEMALLLGMRTSMPSTVSPLVTSIRIDGAVGPRAPNAVRTNPGLVALTLPESMDGQQQACSMPMIIGPEVRYRGKRKVRKRHPREEFKAALLATPDEYAKQRQKRTAKEVAFLAHPLRRWGMPILAYELRLHPRQAGASRGVLVDIPRCANLPYLEPGTAIYIEDF